ncbi:MAG: peptidyl-prolyl cis-trans isomerase [Nanoarchaeota archaeon]|nr:peptidyl-prolyl cis-trans isomerase [Nanoarchaeota archaeon]
MNTVMIETSMGNIKVVLDAQNAPVSVANFLSYVDSGYYNGLIFHRIIDGFMIQGGGFDSQMNQKPVNQPIKNEAGNGLRNEKYTLAMARTSIVDSATSQFFINTEDNAFLDHTDNSPRGYGYAVFGKVTSGFEVVDRISQVKTHTVGQYENVPVTPVTILKVYRI